MDDTSLSDKELLHLFREFVLRNVVVWAVGAVGASHPIWKMVANRVSSKRFTKGPEYRFIQAANQKSLSELQKEEEEPFLLPCPFCGDTQILHWADNSPDSLEKLVAPVCGCGAQGAMYRTKKQAANAWNLRATTTESNKPGLAVGDRVTYTVCKDNEGQYAYAYATITHVHNEWCRIHLDDGRYMAVPTKYLTKAS